MKNLRRLATACVFASLLAAFAVPAASAHATAYSADGKLRFVYGFVTEPATTEIPNRVLLRVLDNVTGAGLSVDFTDVEISLHLGDLEKDLTMVPLRGAAVGNYSSQELIALSQPGIYELHVEGTLAGSSVQVEIPANEELTDINEIMWPPVEPTSDRIESLEQQVALLKAQVETLTAKLATQAQTPAAVTTQNPTPTGNGSSPVPAIGLVALLGAVAIGMMLRRSK